MMMFSCPAEHPKHTRRPGQAEARKALGLAAVFQGAKKAGRRDCYATAGGRPAQRRCRSRPAPHVDQHARTLEPGAEAPKLESTRYPKMDPSQEYKKEAVDHGRLRPPGVDAALQPSAELDARNIEIPHLADA
jgi:hypothetical protein